MCIAVLVVVVVLGIYRIHLTHQQEVKLAEAAKEADVTWDESALTITVNPMEVGGWGDMRKCLLCIKSFKGKMTGFSCFLLTF